MIITYKILSYFNVLNVWTFAGLGQTYDEGGFDSDEYDEDMDGEGKDRIIILE